MDYFNFLDEFDSYNEWNNVQKKQKKVDESLDEHYNSFYDRQNKLEAMANDPVYLGGAKDDRVNSPSHYTSGKTEVIDVIEDAVKDAPSNIYGMLQGQVLKYMLRVWLKDNPLEDLKKAKWYLERLIAHYSEPPGDSTFPPGRWDRSLDDFKS